MDNLILIGNGFDLAHGMKTRYKDFISHLIKRHCKSKNRKRYNDLFNLPKFINSIGDIEDKFNPFSQYPEELIPDEEYEYWKAYDFLVGSICGATEYEPKFKSPLILWLLKNLTTQNWCDIENLYFKILTSIAKPKGISTNGQSRYYYPKPKYLNDDFEIIKKYLESYLIAQQKKERKSIDSYSYFFEKVNSEDTLILNFNYTDTLQRLYEKEISKCHVIHIHGKLSDTNNPIIFGFAADNKEARELSNKDDYEYMRNIKKHLYKRTANEKRLTGYLSLKKNIYVSILGHSGGISDKLILHQITNDPNVKEIRTFYYKDHQGYFDVQVNLDRIMKNDDAFRDRIVSFEESAAMPQHDEKPDQIEKFKMSNDKYIQEIIDSENSNFGGSAFYSSLAN